MENPIKMDDLGGKPTIFGNTNMEPEHHDFQKGMVLFQAFRGVHCSGSMLVLLGCNKRQPLRLRLRHDHDMHFPKISVPFGGLGKCINVCQTKVLKVFQDWCETNV